MIKIFKSVKRRQALPEFNVPADYATTTPEFKELYNKGGVYLLYTESDNKQKPIYIGRAENNAAHTILRHSQKWSANEKKYVEREPKQLDRLWVKFEDMTGQAADDIINRETELIEKYKPYLNIRKGADAHKDPERYKVTQERREEQKKFWEFLNEKPKFLQGYETPKTVKKAQESISRKPNRTSLAHCLDAAIFLIEKNEILKKWKEENLRIILLIDEIQKQKGCDLNFEIEGKSAQDIVSKACADFIEITNPQQWKIFI